jgi:hypothetical protein
MAGARLVPVSCIATTLKVFIKVTVAILRPENSYACGVALPLQTVTQKRYDAARVRRWASRLAWNADTVRDLFAP